MSAIFVDLDNTLIRTKSNLRFPMDYDDWELIPEVLEFIKSKINLVDKVIIVTNQGGIEAGFVDENQFCAKVDKIVTKIFNQWNIDISIIYFSKTNDKNEPLRKPNPGMAYRAYIEHRVALINSIMIGDASNTRSNFSNSDYMFAKNAGLAQYFDVKDIIAGRPRNLLL